MQCFNGDIRSIRFGKFEWVVESATWGVDVREERKICFRFSRLLLLSFLVKIEF